jgi:hypothetical protein
MICARVQGSAEEDLKKYDAIREKRAALIRQKEVPPFTLSLPLCLPSYALCPMPYTPYPIPHT